MKKIFVFVGTIFLLSFSSLGLAEMKIGVLDVNRVLVSVPQVKTMQINLKKEYDARGSKIIEMQNKFIADINKYKQSNVNMKGDDLKKEQQKLIDENKILQEARTLFQRDLVAAQNRALQPILRQIEAIVERIAKTQKFDLIMAKMSTVYINPQFEITDQVIAEVVKLVPAPIPAPVAATNASVKPSSK